MSRVVTYEVAVEFGDCDPARIVYYPNFFRWIDASSRRYFLQCGVPSWEETEASHGIIGTPLVDVKARFMRPATYGDKLAIDTTVAEWRSKSFVMTHTIRRGGEVLVEATEVRVFAKRVPGERARIEAAEIPGFVRDRCGS